MQNTPFNQLVKEFARLPGLGPRSAKRIALHLLVKGQEHLEHFATTLNETAAHMAVCEICGNLDQIQPCKICQDAKRDPAQLCIIASIGDLWAIERAGTYRGSYHVLGGVLSALDGITPDQLSLSALENRLNNSPDITEIILALSATVDGQTTAHYVSDLIHRHHNQIKITRLAHGMPVGGELDYLDDGTIMSAFKSRRAV